MSSVFFYLFLLIKNPLSGNIGIESSSGSVKNYNDSTIISKEVGSLKKLALYQISPKESLVEKIGLKEMGENRLLFYRDKSHTELFINLKRLDSNEAKKTKNHFDKYIINSVEYRHIKIQNEFPIICNEPTIIDYDFENASSLNDFLPIQVFCSKDVVRIYVCIYKNAGKSDMKILLLKNGLFDSCIN